jgi:F420-dependent oxidoreductase-like protein
MRIGIMIGPDRGRYRDKVARMVDGATTAEAAGFSSIWVPQIPSDFDALTAITLMAQATTTVELGTAVLPIQSRHPVAMAQQVLSTQAVAEGRLTVGLGPSHHWIVEDMLGLSYDRPAHQVRTYLEVLNVAFAGPGPVDVENDTWRVHNPLDITDLPPTPILLAALAPLMLKIAGEQTSGTILWMADQRAIGGHVVPKLTAAAEAAGRPAPRVVAGVPVALCAPDELDAVKEWTNEMLGHAEYSPNYQRLLEEGDARDVGDVLAAGDEESVRSKLASFAAAGVTDLAVRVVPFGADGRARYESRRRTEEFCASLDGTF